MSNENNWLNVFLGLEFSSQKIESAKNFVLFWSLFERYFCNKYANLKIIEEKLNELLNSYKLPNSVFFYYCFFRNRYFTNGEINTHFQSLNFRDRNPDLRYKERLIEILEKEQPSDNDKLFACFIIIYRYRNNLFHGSKNIARLEGQIEIFEKSNQFLQEFLDFLKSKNKLRS